MPATPPATVLVLERSAAVQELIDQTLREAGHRVLSTKNSLEALDLVRRVRIDVVVAGELLEERTESFVKELRSIQAALEVVTISRFDDELGRTDPLVRLAAPLCLDELLAAVAVARDQSGR